MTSRTRLIVLSDNLPQFVVDRIDMHFIVLVREFHVRLLHEYCLVQWEVERRTVDIVRVEITVFYLTSLAIVDPAAVGWLRRQRLVLSNGSRIGR